MKKIIVLIITFLQIANIAMAKSFVSIQTETVLLNQLENLSDSLRLIREMIEKPEPSIKQARYSLKESLQSQKKITKNSEKLLDNSNREDIKNIKKQQKAIKKLLKKTKKSKALAKLEEAQTLIETNNDELIEMLENNKAQSLELGINTGIYGTVKLISGNCMPDVDDGKTDCKSSPVSRRIFVRQTSNVKQGQSPVYYVFDTPAIASTVSDNSGKFKLELKPGGYSIFVQDEGKNYCNTFDAKGNACTFEVQSGKAKEYNIDIDHAFW